MDGRGKRNFGRMGNLENEPTTSSWAHWVETGTTEEKSEPLCHSRKTGRVGTDGQGPTTVQPENRTDRQGRNGQGRNGCPRDILNEPLGSQTKKQKGEGENSTVHYPSQEHTTSQSRGSVK